VSETGKGGRLEMMAGRAEQGIGDPTTVATSAAILASDLLHNLQSS
jgi:hypothetical protein